MQTVASYSNALLMELSPDRSPPRFAFERHIKRNERGPLGFAVGKGTELGRGRKQNNVPGLGSVQSRTRVGSSRDPCAWTRGLPAGNRSARVTLDPPSYA